MNMRNIDCLMKILMTLCVFFGITGCTSNKEAKEVESTNISQFEKDKELDDIDFTQYKVIKDLPDFEETPIDMYDKGYIVKVDGKYGFIDYNGQWIIENKYKEIHRNSYEHLKMNNVCFGNGTTDEDVENYVFLEEVLNIQENPISEEAGEGFDEELPDVVTLYEDDINRSFYIENGEKVPYRNLFYIDYFEDGTVLDRSDLLHNYGINRGNIMIVNPIDKNGKFIEDKFYAVFRNSDAAGPFTKEDQLSYAFKNNMMHYHNLIVKGLFMFKDEYGYNIYSETGDIRYPGYVKNAEIISENAIKIMSESNKGIISSQDDEIKVILYGQFEDVSKPIDNHAFVKIDGKWQLIEIQ